MNRNKTKEEWLQLVEEQGNSGLTIREYCELQDLNSNTFKYQKKTLKSRQTTPKSGTLVKIPSRKTTAAASCTIELGKMKIHLSTFTADELKTVLTLVQELDHAVL